MIKNRDEAIDKKDNFIKKQEDMIKSRDEQLKLIFKSIQEIEKKSFFKNPLSYMKIIKIEINNIQSLLEK